jgi:O-antigen/teichoic acid export membrane protein
MKLFRDARSVTSSLAVSLLLAAVRSILLLRILGPALMGAWKSAFLLDTFGEFARMSFSRAMGMRVPVLDGRKDDAEARRLISTTGAFSLYLGVVLGLAIFCVSFLAQNSDLRTALRIVAAVTAVGQPYFFLRELAAAHHLFHLVTRETLIRSVIDFTAGLLLCALFGLRGLGISAVLAIVVVFIYLRHQQKVRFNLALDTPRLRGLLNLGVPYSLSEMTFEVLRRLDVIVMALVLGPVAVGYYGTSLLIMEFSVVLARKGVGQVVSPHLLREFGRTGSVMDAAVFYEMPLRLFCYALPPLIGVGSLFIGDFVRLCLPQYSAGIPAAQITMWTMFFVALHASINAFFVASDMILVIWRIFGVLIPFGAAAQFLVMRAGFGLTGAATCSLATLAIVAATEIYVARNRCGHSLGEIAGFIASLYLPLAISIGLTQLVDLTPLMTGLKALVFLAFYAPVLLMYELKFSILRTVRQAM